MRNNFTEKWSRLFAAKRYDSETGTIELSVLEQQELLDDAQSLGRWIPVDEALPDSIEEMIDIICDKMNWDKRKVLSKSREPINVARRCCIYNYLLDSINHSNSAIANAMGLHHATGIHMQKVFDGKTSTNFLTVEQLKEDWKKLSIVDPFNFFE